MSFKCELCDAVLESKYSRESADWNWFHGYLPETVHFCPAHKRSSEYFALIELSRKKPELREV